jgi:biofilm PGA synthesis N-glycosyltransferase PgaC
MTAHKENYVLITPARNEEAYIEKTIHSIIDQTVLPKKWVIVSDGSTDCTDEIIQTYALRYDFIRFISSIPASERSFSSKVQAFNAGYAQLADIPYDFIGNLDADVSFDPHYFKEILERFNNNSRLGVAGGWVYELENGKFTPRFGSTRVSVPGSIMLFRTKCFLNIKGYIPLPMGGEDTVAEIMAKMHGWETLSFPDLRVFHHRKTGTGNSSIYLARFRQGIEEYAVGTHPLFLLSKALRRVIEKPYFVGSMLRLTGFTFSYLRRENRQIPDNVMHFIRYEQMKRLRSYLKCKNI